MAALSWLRGHWQLLALIALVAALWNTPAILPLKILVVFLHELSHGLAAWITGGEVISFDITPDQGGTAWTRGGNRIAILSAGYLGSLFFGAALLFAGLNTRADRAIAAALGLGLIAITLIYMRGLFPMGFGLAAGAALLAIARFLPHEASDLVLRLIGLTSLIYVPLDIFSDTIARAHLRSDAAMLAEELGGGTRLWGGLWLTISLATILTSMRFGLGRTSNLPLPSRKPR